MVYFFILPAFVLAVLVQALAIVVATFVPALAPVRPYGWRILLASTIGFVVANVALFVLSVLPMAAWNAAGLPQGGPTATVLTLLAVFGLTVGPVLASAVGFAGGGYCGFRLGKRAREIGAGRSLEQLSSASDIPARP